MKHRFWITLLCAFVATGLAAAERYSISLMPTYHYNKTMGSTGELGINLALPVRPHLELALGTNLSLTNRYGMALDVRPKLPVKVGEIFCELDLRYQLLKDINQHDMVAALAVGYRTDYASIKLGYYIRRLFYAPTHDGVWEKANLLYSLDIYARPQSSRWNLWLSISNADDFLIERMWSPMGRLGAWFNLTDHLRIAIDGQLQLAGVFHMNAELENAYARAGLVYRF